MKRLFILCALTLILIGGQSYAAGEWLVCDPALENIDTDLGNDVVHYMVKLNELDFVQVPYNANGTGFQKLWEVTGMTTAVFQIYAVNAQGRASEVVTFSLAAPPTGCENIRTQVVE